MRHLFGWIHFTEKTPGDPICLSDRRCHTRLFQRILQTQKSILQCFVCCNPGGSFRESWLFSRESAYRRRLVYVDGHPVSYTHLDVYKRQVVFLRIMLCTTWVYAVSNPLITAASATGKIKLYQSVVGGLLLLILPISYLCLRLGLPAYRSLIHIYSR